MENDGKIKKFWMNLSAEHRYLLAIAGLVFGFILICVTVAGSFNLYHSWRYSNKIENSIEKTNEHKSNSNSIETNANVLSPQIEQSRTQNNIAVKNRIQAQQTSNNKRAEINEALKNYEKNKIRNTNRIISNSELSDDAIRERANRLGISVDTGN